MVMDHSLHNSGSYLVLVGLGQIQTSLSAFYDSSSCMLSSHTRSIS